MISMLKSWSGAVEINGVRYDNINAFLSGNNALAGDISIKLYSAERRAEKQSVKENAEKQTIKETAGVTEYQITVKQYMTKKADPGFDFMAKWNNDNPMPLRTMVGTIEKETRGMVYMKLHGRGLKTVTCMCCGRELTNPISRHYGIGPICMEKVGIQCDINNIEEIKEKLADVTWEGWIIKSAITEQEAI